MARINIRDGLPIAVAGSLALHAFLVCALVAGRAGPQHVAAPVAPGHAAADGLSVVAVDLLTFPGPRAPGREAPTPASVSTAAAPPGAPGSRHGSSDRTILPTDQQTPTPVMGMPEPAAADAAPDRMVGRIQAPVDSTPAARTAAPTPPIDEPGAADIVVLPIGLPRTLSIGMPQRLAPEPVLPLASTESARPSSPVAGPSDRSLLPVEAPPAPVAAVPDIEMPQSLDVAAARPSPAGPDAGPGTASETTLPVDLLPVPMPPKVSVAPTETPAATPPANTRTARAAPRRPRGAVASRTLDPHRHYGIYGESGPIASVNGIGGASGAATFNRQRRRSH